MSNEESRRDWLDQFPAQHRGAIANWFYEVVRIHGGDVPLSQGCSEVYRDQARQLQRYGQRMGGGVDKLAVLRAMQKDPAGTRQFMAWVIRQEGRTPEERQRDKEAREAEGKRAHMERLAPTQKQLDTLLRLGVDELPENRWRASELIEEHKDW